MRDTGAGGMTDEELEARIKGLLKVHGTLGAAFITRFLNEGGVPCTRQKVERVLRRMISSGKVEFSYSPVNRRRQYRLRGGGPSD